MEGIIKSFLVDRGFGFIRAGRGEPDVFFHINELRASGIESVAAGDRVEFETKDKGDGRKYAVSLRILSRAQ